MWLLPLDAWLLLLNVWLLPLDEWMLLLDAWLLPLDEWMLLLDAWLLLLDAWLLPLIVCPMSLFSLIALLFLGFCSLHFIVLY